MLLLERDDECLEEFTIRWSGKSKYNSLCGGEVTIEASAKDIAKNILLDELRKKSIKVETIHYIN